MPVMQKWNPKTHQYEEYEVPNNWNTPIYSDNMQELVNCARCGRELTYGKCYTSKQIHNFIGFGYPVCAECYEQEREEECQCQSKM